MIYLGRPSELLDASRQSKMAAQPKLFRFKNQYGTPNGIGLGGCVGTTIGHLVPHPHLQPPLTASMSSSESSLIVIACFVCTTDVTGESPLKLDPYFFITIGCASQLQGKEGTVPEMPLQGQPPATFFSSSAVNSLSPVFVVIFIPPDSAYQKCELHCGN